MSEELISCKYCGGKAQIITIERYFAHTVDCKNRCISKKNMAVFFNEISDAIKTWNMPKDKFEQFVKEAKDDFERFKEMEAAENEN